MGLHQEIYQRYLLAGPVGRDPAAQAALFTEDGVYEAPLVPAGHVLPRRLVGREAIRAGVAIYHRELPVPGRVDAARSSFVLHDTADPDVFIAELDTAFLDPPTSVALVQIFRLRGDLIAVLRDYFTPPAP